MINCENKTLFAALSYYTDYYYSGFVYATKSAFLWRLQNQLPPPPPHMCMPIAHNFCIAASIIIIKYILA
jgi:hypothetical protein